ncbi:MAG: hypothetical protein JSV04_14045 [Candidatus Heimdallarchaeota archaeon]|nr:MAG: hypothetical protein JSV04_14045 [Candidatus Heimdallarchaeota archaeon]
MTLVKPISDEDSSIDTLVSVLMDIGLTRNEARAYMELLPRESATASYLVRQTGIPDSKIYYIMDNLQKEGFIIVQEGKPKKYVAINPSNALENMRTKFTAEYENKIAILDQLVNSLAPIYHDREDAPKLAYIIKGKNNVINQVKRLMIDAQSSIILMIPTLEIFHLLEKTIEGVQKEKITTMGLYHKSIPTEPLPFKFQGIACECFFLIVDNKILLTISNWKADLWYAIWTTETSLIEVSQGYFSSPCCTYETT